MTMIIVPVRSKLSQHYKLASVNSILGAIFFKTAPINSNLNVVVRSPTSSGLEQNGCWPSQGSQLPQAFPSYKPFLNECKRTAHSLLKSVARLLSSKASLLILLLLLMSANIYPNPGSVFPCSVCAGNVTWKSRSVQCYNCSNLRCSFKVPTTLLY